MHIRALTLQRLLQHIAWKKGDDSEGARGLERSRRILLATLASILLKLSGVLTLTVTTPLIHAYMDAGRFGLWMTISALLVVLSFLDFGVGNALINILADAHGANDKRAAGEAVTSAFVLHLCVAGILVLSALFVVDLLDINRLLGLYEHSAAKEGVAAIKIMIIGLALSIPLQAAQKVQTAYQDGFSANLWQLASSLATFVVLMICINRKSSVPTLVMALAFTPIVVAMVNWVHQFNFVRPWLRPSRRRFNRSMSLGLLALGAIWTWSQVVGFVGTSTDNIIISAHKGAAAVGCYAVMARLQSVLMISQLLAIPLWPAFSEAIQRGDWTWARATFNRTVRLFVFIGVCSAAVLGVGSFYIVPWWLGSDMVPTPALAGGFAAWAVISNFFFAISALLANRRSIVQFTMLTTVAALISILIKFYLVKHEDQDLVIWGAVIGYGSICVPAFFLASALLKGESISSARVNSSARAGG